MRGLCSADDEVGSAFKQLVAKGIADSTSCKKAYEDFICVWAAEQKGVAPCDAPGGNPMLSCFELCTEFQMKCPMGRGIATLPPSPPQQEEQH